MCYDVLSFKNISDTLHQDNVWCHFPTVTNVIGHIPFTVTVSTDGVIRADTVNNLPTQRCIFLIKRLELTAETWEVYRRICLGCENNSAKTVRINLLSMSVVVFFQHLSVTGVNLTETVDFKTCGLCIVCDCPAVLL